MVTRDETARNAAEFLKLWQEQLTRQMTDPDAIHAMLAAMQSFSGANAGPQHDAGPRRATAASDAHHDAIRLLTQRIERLERYVAKLSAQLDDRVSPRVAKAKNPARAGVRSHAKPKPATKRNGPKLAKRSAQPSAKKRISKNK